VAWSEKNIAEIARAGCGYFLWLDQLFFGKTDYKAVIDANALKNCRVFVNETPK